MCSNKNPPKLSDGDDYEMWRHNVSVWIEFTELAVEKKGLAIHMALTGRAQIASSELTIAQLKAEGGAQAVLDKLDAVFLPEAGRRQFSTFRELYRLKRDQDEDIESFIAKFEHLSYKLRAQTVVLPSSVLAFMLLESCNLEESQNQLILSRMTDINDTNMKAALKRVFGHNAPTNRFKTIKTEPEDVKSSEALFARSGRNYN